MELSQKSKDFAIAAFFIVATICLICLTVHFCAPKYTLHYATFHKGRTVEITKEVHGNMDGLDPLLDETGE